MDFNLRKRNKRPARYAIWGSIFFLLATLALVALELLNTYQQEEENALRQANGLSQCWPSGWPPASAKLG
ncbi:hypothetical protein JOS77_01780 [Chromobacterium haemolyticum]|nr:hypothetical protein JOS77_01780 [Chromobacterium haemolyticum]